MKINKKSQINQKTLMEKKVQLWLPLRTDQPPRSGWLKAIRGALGMSTRQLAERLAVAQSSVTRLEEREPSGNITLERLSRAAGAMNCKLVYAIVPRDSYDSLDAIIDERAKNVAEHLVRKTEHSMRLEKQGTSDDLAKEIHDLSTELKSKMDPRIWSKRAAGL